MAFSMSDLITHVAASDCERLRPGLVAQPVNTLSSLAYCAAGAWVLARLPSTSRRRLLGSTAIFAGVGSVAYHGPGGPVGKLVHDVSAGAMAGVIAYTTLVSRGRVLKRLAVGGCLAAAGAVHAASRTDRVLCR